MKKIGKPIDTQESVCLYSGMDWKKLISDLVTTGGMSQGEISKATGIAQPTISDLLRGKQGELRWRNGDSLIRLHRRKVASARRAA